MEGSVELRNVLLLDTVLPSHAGCYAIGYPQGHRTNTASRLICHCLASVLAHLTFMSAPTPDRLHRPSAGLAPVHGCFSTPTPHQHCTKTSLSLTAHQSMTTPGLDCTGPGLTLHCSGTALTPHQLYTTLTPLRHYSNTARTLHQHHTIAGLTQHMVHINAAQTLAADDCPMTTP